GGGGEDILIGGTTAYDRDEGNREAMIPPASFAAIMAEWTRTDLAGTPLQVYQQKINHLMNGGGPNGPYRLNATTVSSDGVANTLTGGADLDWFFANALDTTDWDPLAGEQLVLL